MTYGVFTYQMPTRVIFGCGAVNRLPEILSGFNVRSAFIVTGKSSMRVSGKLDRVVEQLKPFSPKVFDGVPPNPTIETYERALIECRKSRCDAVVALGGGSSLDVAKVTAILPKNKGRLQDYLSGTSAIEHRGLPFVAIPTTAGSGSEVTPWASVWNSTELRKTSLSHPWMFPNVALVDPELTLSLPPHITAYTGIDALAHAIEAYWSRSTQPISSALSLEAVQLILNNLAAACESPSSLAARQNMSLGCLFAGLSFSNTKTTICHALSYPITAHFGVPHGIAVGITLPLFLRWNAEAMGDRVRSLLDRMGAETAVEAAGIVTELMRRVGLPVRLRDINVTQREIGLILDEGFAPDRAEHNPRHVSREDLGSLLSSIL